MSDEEIRQGFKRLCASPVQVIPAKVTVVDEENYTIDVKPAGRAELFEVRLKAGIDGVKDGVVELPEKGSSVLIGIIGNDKDTAFVLKCSKVTKVIINNGENGGLINIKTLVERINRLEERMGTHQHLSAAPGSPTAPDPATNKVIVNTKVGDLEDGKVVH